MYNRHCVPGPPGSPAPCTVAGQCMAATPRPARPGWASPTPLTADESKSGNDIMATVMCRIVRLGGRLEHDAVRLMRLALGQAIALPGSTAAVRWLLATCRMLTVIWSVLSTRRLLWNGVEPGCFSVSRPLASSSANTSP